MVDLPQIAPPTEFGRETFDRMTAIPPYDFDSYGEGLCRRRIRLINASETATIGELEDDFHHFRVELTHDTDKVLSVSGLVLRAPWSTCSEADLPLQKIVGKPLSSDSTAIGSYATPTSNCTHLFDLTGLAISHSMQGDSICQYDLMVTDPLDEQQVLRLWKNGELLLDWVIREGVIISPKDWKGVSLVGKFIAWAKGNLDPLTAEAAIALRRMTHISTGHGINLDKLEKGAEHTDGPIGRCYTYSNEVLIRAKRMRGTVRDFTKDEHASLMLSDMEARGSSGCEV